MEVPTNEVTFYLSFFSQRLPCCQTQSSTLYRLLSLPDLLQQENPHHPTSSCFHHLVPALSGSLWAPLHSTLRGAQGSLSWVPVTSPSSHRPRVTPHCAMIPTCASSHVFLPELQAHAANPLLEISSRLFYRCLRATLFTYTRVRTHTHPAPSFVRELQKLWPTHRL